MSRRNSLLRRYAGGGDRYAEEVLEAGARETCRFSRAEGCLTFFSRWAYDHPRSSRLQTVLAEVRASLGARRASLAPKKIGDMQVLFGGELNASGYTLEGAQALTKRYTTHYNHAVPFGEGVLEAIWDRCRGLRCGAARRNVEGRLGTREGGSWAAPAVEQGGTTRYLTPPLESSPTTPGLSPDPGSN